MKASRIAFEAVSATILAIVATPGVAQTSSPSNEANDAKKQESICPPSVDGEEQRQPNDAEWSKAGEFRLLTGVIGIAECWKTDVADGRQRYLSEFYGSWIIQEIYADPALVRDYRKEGHAWLTRLFVGRTNSMVVSATIQMHEPDVAFTFPLMSVDYNGKAGEGESFVTTLTRSDMTQPWFKISPNSSASIEVNARTSKTVDIRAAGLIVGTLKDALALAAPGSTLVTALNKDQVTKVSTTFDAGLSRIWSNSIAETTSSSRSLNEWFPDSSFLVSVNIPTKIKTGSETQEDPEKRRIWFRIKLACPRLSVFDSANVCEGKRNNDFLNLNKLSKSPFRYSESDRGVPGVGSDVYRQYLKGLKSRISAHQVLNFRLATGKTVREFLTSQDWFAAFSRQLAKPEVTQQGATVEAASAAKAPDSKAKAEGAVTAQFCESVVEALYNIGLSRLDADIGLWAVAAALPDFAGASKAFTDNIPCYGHFPGYHGTKAAGGKISDDERWQIDD